MQLTPEQVKGRIKNVAKENKADARTLMRIYMMERFLERVANSQYKDNFIIKGGMLVTAMVGVALRSTMDIDTSIKNQNLSAEDARRIVDEIKDIDLGDGVTFEVKEVSNIMDEMEYPGIRFTMNAVMGKLVTPMKIDISTGDVITPRAIEYNYKLLLDDRSISLWSYNLETILAEKLQAVLARGLLNTRMRDFYDIKTLLSIYEQDIDADVLKKAFEATCKKRSTENLKEEAPKIMAAVSDDAQLHTLWKSYAYRFGFQSTGNRASAKISGTGFDQVVEFSIGLSKESDQPHNQGYAKQLSGMMSFDEMLRKFEEGYQYCYLCEIEEFENCPEGVQGGAYDNRLLIAYYLDSKFTNPINVSPVLKRTIYGNRKMYVWKFAFTQEILEAIQVQKEAGTFSASWFGIWNTRKYSGEEPVVCNVFLCKKSLAKRLSVK